MNFFEVKPVVLEGTHVRLEPLTTAHWDAYRAAALVDPDLCQLMVDAPRTSEAHRVLFDRLLLKQTRGEALPFATIDKASGRLAGSTALCLFAPEHRRLEIGHTWICREFQRSHINTEAKFLQLRHSFEQLGCNRVELKTDSLNEKSRRAILRIGAKEEGVFRSHMITQSGRIRDSIYFSVIAPEWPATKARLLELMTHPASKRSQTP
jgi:RimJ/RimL family protein N-acetyltransferase